MGAGLWGLGLDYGDYGIWVWALGSGSLRQHTSTLTHTLVSPQLAVVGRLPAQQSFNDLPPL